MSDPTPNIDAAQPLPAASSMPLPTPVAPAASAQPTAQPTANATGQPTTPTVTPQVSAAHRPGLYDRVLQGMAGGPTTVNGVDQPMTRKSLTAHILAGAITGIIQGSAKGYQQPIGPAGTRSGQIGAAAAGGFEATGQALQDARNQPQAQADQKQAQLTAQQIQQYNALKRNIDLQQTMLGLGNANRAALEAAEAPGKLLWQKAQDQDETSASDQKIVLDNTPAIATDLLKKYPQLSQQNFLLVDHQDILNPDGTTNIDERTGLPHQMPLFVPVNPNIKLQMDDETKAEMIKNNPTLAKTLDKVPTLTPVNMGYYIDHATNHIAVTGATDNLTSAAKQITAVTGVPVDVTDIVSKNPLLRRNAGVISHYFGHGEGADEVIDKMIKNNAIPQNAINALQTALHLSDVNDDGRTVAQQLKDKREATKKDTDQEVKPFTVDSALEASQDGGNPKRQQQAKAWLAANKQYQQDVAGGKAAAEVSAKAKAAASTSDFADFSTPDALGYQPQANRFADNEKAAVSQYNKVKAPFKKNADDLAKMEGTYQQFEDILKDVNAGKDLTGAQSVVALFNAIGISAEPLAGKGFRINSNTIEEHRDALSMPDNLAKKGVAMFKNGEVVTPQQVRDYADIALQTRQSKYVNLVNEVHNQGLEC